MFPVIDEIIGAGIPAALVPPVLQATAPSVLTAKIESLPAVTVPAPTITNPKVWLISGVLATEGKLTSRTHFTRVTATLVTT